MTCLNSRPVFCGFQFLFSFSLFLTYVETEFSFQESSKLFEASGKNSLLIEMQTKNFL